MKNIVADKINISLTDLCGRKVNQWNWNYAANEMQLSISDVVPGCYLLNIHTTQYIQTQKLFVIQK